MYIYQFICARRGMKNTDDFSKNHKIRSSDDLSLNEETVQDFIDQFGIEQAIGYMKAVRHFVLEFAVYDLRPESNDAGRPLKRVHNNVCKLLIHKENFLKAISDSEIIRLNLKPE